MAISPLIFSVIYDEVGNVRGQEMLVAQQRIQCIDPSIRCCLEVILKLTRKQKMLRRTPLPSWLNVMELILLMTVSKSNCQWLPMYFFRSIWWRVEACKRLSVERSQEHNAINIIFTVLSPFVSGTIPTRIWKNSLDLCFTEDPPHATHHPFIYEIGWVLDVLLPFLFFLEGLHFGCVLPGRGGICTTGVHDAQTCDGRSRGAERSQLLRSFVGWRICRTTRTHRRWSTFSEPWAWGICRC